MVLKIGSYLGVFVDVKKRYKIVVRRGKLRKLMRAECENSWTNRVREILS